LADEVKKYPQSMVLPQVYDKGVKQPDGPLLLVGFYDQVYIFYLSTIWSPSREGSPHGGACMMSFSATGRVLAAMCLVLSVPVEGTALNPIVPEILQRKAAILDLTLRNQESQSSVISLEQAIQVAGIPYMVTTDVTAACGCEMVLVSSTLYSKTLSVLEKNQLAEYVWDGGVLVAPNIRDVFFYPLFGINGYAQGRTRTQLTWQVANFPEMGRWLDDPNEITIRLSNPDKYPEGLPTQAYLAGGFRLGGIR